MEIAKKYLKKIKKILKGKFVYIFPHDNADVDAMISALLLSELLKFLKIPSKVVLIDGIIAKDTQKILKILGYDMYQFIDTKENKDRDVILVDHCLKQGHFGNVNLIIDHHHIDDFKKAWKKDGNKENPFYIYEKASSASMIIYHLMLAANMPITLKIISMISYATMVDTASFRSTKSQIQDKIIIESQCKSFGIDYFEISNEALLLQKLDEMTNQELLNNGKKIYSVPGYENEKYGATYVQITNEEYIKNKTILKRTIETIREEKIKKERFLFWIFIVYKMGKDLTQDETIVFYITQKNEYIEKYEKYMSRGDSIIPKVTKEKVDKLKK